MSAAATRESTLILPDGRTLAYATCGDPGGRPVLHFHGTPGSRLEIATFAAYLKRDDLFLFCMDRPGYGHSSMKRNWKVDDIPEDAARLADHLRIERFSVSGYSGGGPFALACARRMPERLVAVGIISGVGPAATGSQGMHDANRRKFDMAQRMPRLAKALIRLAVGAALRKPGGVEKMLEQAQAHMPQVDRDVFCDRRFLDLMIRETQDALANGAAGMAHEEILMATPWGFRPEDICHPHLHIWHGALDRNVPIAMAKAAAQHISGCTAHFYEDEGHISLIYRRGQEIFDTLLGGYALTH